LLDAVSDAELRAVLVHERYHVRNLDPLKVVVARAVPAAFFFLPALRHLRGCYLAGRELAADRRAMQSCGRRPLAGALYKVARASAPLPSLAAAAAIGGSELLEVRLAQLEDGHEPPLPTISPPVLASTVVAVVLMTLGLAATATVAGLPVAGGGMGSSGPMALLGALACGGIWGWISY
jgi:beta-lactamase regulating signal transducer with metallopeptidase domain